MVKEALMETMPAEGSFAALLEESVGSQNLIGTVLQGTVVGVESGSKGHVVVDVGLKSEGRISFSDISPSGSEPNIKPGDKIDVFLERMEGPKGEIVLSREKALREEAWARLDEVHAKGERVEGIMFGRVRGGFTVDLEGVIAFLPGSQVDLRPIRDVDALMGIRQPFMILKMDKQRNNIVVSRRAVLEEDLFESRSGVMKDLGEGSKVKGVVKNITDYGAFVDLGGIDGLLHVTDIAWKRVKHPSDALEVGQELEAVVIRYDKEKQRISLGIKQLNDDPWKGVGERFKISDKYKGMVTNVTDYGAFIELENGVEGLVHVSEMSWSKKNIYPSKIVSVDQKVDVMVLEVDESKRRIALGLKQCMTNPWKELAQNLKVGSAVEGKIRNITEFGLFIQMTDEIDGMVHMSDLAWDRDPDQVIKEYNKGDVIKVKILEIDPDKERIALGVKQLTQDPFSEASSSVKKGEVVTCKITNIKDDMLEVEITGKDTPVIAYIKKPELSKDHTERRTDRFAVDEKLDAKVHMISKSDQKIYLSKRALEIEDEKKAMDKYGSVDSGASLGDILGEALEKTRIQEEKAAEQKEEKKKTTKKATKKAEVKEEADSE